MFPNATYAVEYMVETAETNISLIYFRDIILQPPHPPPSPPPRSLYLLNAGRQVPSAAKETENTKGYNVWTLLHITTIDHELVVERVLHACCPFCVRVRCVCCTILPIYFLDPPMCLHRGAMCLHRGAMCLHRGALCSHRGALFLHRGALCSHRGALAPPPLAFFVFTLSCPLSNTASF